LADSSIIREFLVGLGFKVDDKKLKDFTQSIDKATQFVGKLALGMEAMAVAVTASVTKVSSQFEDLYYASIRMSDSVENIRGMTFAIGQLGGTAQGGMQALENLGEFFRSNPGGERFVQDLGVQTRNANGELRGMTEVLHDLGTALKAMPYYRAKVVAGVLGIDPRTLQALLRDTGEAQSRFHDLAQRMGIDQDKAAKASHDFMNDLRELMAVLTLTLDRIVLTVQPVFRQIVQGLEELDRVTGGWSTALIVLAGLLLPLLVVLDPIVLAVVALGAGLVYLISRFSDWRSGLTGIGGGLADIWDALQPLVKAVEAFGVVLYKVFGPALTPILNMAFTMLADGLHMVADVIRLVIDLLTGNWAKAWKDNKALGLDMVKTITDQMTGLWEVVKKVGGGLQAAWRWLNHEQPEPAARAGSGAPAAAANQNTPEQAATGIAGQIGTILQKHGFTQANALGMVAGIFAESRFNTNAKNNQGGGQGAFGIGQWRGSRLAELRKRYGQNPGLEQQVEFMLWELSNSEKDAGNTIKGQGTARGSMQAYLQNYMRPGQGLFGDLQRGNSYLASPKGGAGGGTVALNQTTHITVAGSSDPHATARAVAVEQARVNDGMVRNLKVAAS
jgi:hypothetical protein